ncbi:nuclear export mediator factor NEMF [Zea mays]|uniref:CCHC-type domain-containing protein n=1 Tax=Zea mays TaxID=4577 RepID=A0A804N5K2_MAIZE|nr:nuclear export mediator factor NEMF [Zea mays]|eukprot:XP_008674338.1 nuclear export mediator factor NEMF [Zea mays]
MVKARMTTTDVAAEVKCLRRLIGMRLANVYDITPKTYLFKLMNSSGITESGESEKVLLLMESGVRFHTTQYVRDKSTTPSGFTLKLRKHIRNKRLEDVRMLGYDRIILFQFGLGSNAHFIILELYAQGNILLTDSEYTVLTLLRSHRDDNKGLAIMSRHRYPVEACRVFGRTDFAKLKDMLTKPDKADDKEEITSGSTDAQETSQSTNDEVLVTEISEKSLSKKEKKAAAKAKQFGSNAKVNNGAQSNKATLKTILGEALAYGPALAEHIILDAGLVPSTKVGKDPESTINDSTVQSLMESITRFEDWLVDIISGQRIPEGYILMQNKMTAKNITPLEEASINHKIYDEYCPVLLNQFKSREYNEFATFDAALDEFYSKIESQKVNQQQKAKEESAAQRLNKIKLDQENRVHTLRKEVDHCVKMAELIEYNLEDVDAAILAVRVSLANEMSWEALTRMIKEERKAGNPVAGLIDKLNFERNCITLLLSNNLDDMDEDEKTAPVEKVEVDIALSAHANARRWYEMKKKQESKQEKTITAHDKAFKAAEKKTRLQLAQEKTVAAITHMRKVHWFEKFNWFISSENYLIISGRDAQQNELIVKRYMSKGDLYVHAELHGASSTIIKNHKPDTPIPPLTLNQAGCFTVCHSKAWDSKIVTSAWWVYPHQVSKTAPTGEYLTVGSFMIRGKKNFLPPHPLVMGFGILFRLDESSLASHLNERRVRGEDEALHEMEAESRKKQSNPESDEDIGSEGANKETHEDESNGQTTNIQQNNDLELPDLSSNIGTANSSELLPEIQAEETLDNGSSILKEETIEASVSSQLDDLLDKTLCLGPAKVSGKSSLLTSIPSSLAEDDDDLEVKRPTIRDKPYISKAERRKLKKGQVNDETATDSQNGEAVETPGTSKQEKGKAETKATDSKASQPDTSQQEKGKANTKATGSKLSQPGNSQQEKGKGSTHAGNAKVSRGQKGKLKKIKEKYAEQDEEEREIRMALLASSGKALRKDKPSQDVEETSVKESKPSAGEDDSSKICYKCKKAGHLSRDCPESTSEVDRNDGSISRSRDDTGTNTAPAGGNSPMDEDDVQEIGDEEKEKLIDLDYLTGNPLPNDILLYAVPVCAPYNALQTYKYRVKITPGTAKKGKAAKTAMSLFLHTPDATNREKELMKACTDPELVAAIVGNAKITAPGLTQLKQKQKQKGKKSAKQN